VDLIETLARLSRGSFAESPLAIHFPVIDEFLGLYSDQFHHAKEEDVLFGVLERAITHCGPIPVMLHEHAIGRALRTRMVEAFGARDLVRASREYCGLLTQHIAKENHVLYPMAEQSVPDEECQIREAYAAAALTMRAHCANASSASAHAARCSDSGASRAQTAVRAPSRRCPRWCARKRSSGP
jgi:hypothetical protein